MARFLIDSHIFLWAIEAPEQLTPAEHAILSDPSRDVSVSVVSIWELSIKIAKGLLSAPGRKNPIPADHFERAAQSLEIPIIPIAAPEAEYIRQLPLIHRDPFDRLLIAQAIVTGRTIMTRDAAFSAYPGLQLFQHPSA